MDHGGGRGSGASGLILPFTPVWAEPVWHLFVVRHPERDALKERLDRDGIGTLIHYPVPPHRSEAYAGGRESLPVADELSATVLSLPIGPHLPPSHADMVISAIRVRD